MSVIIPHAQVETIAAMARAVAASSYLNTKGANHEQRVSDAMFVMLYGVELGLPPITALRTIHVVDGKLVVSGQAMLSLMLRAGVRVQMPNPGEVRDSATVVVTRPGGEPQAFTYTRAMAEAAGLTGKLNWQRYPSEMLCWRALSTAARFACPDIVGGLYTPDEIADVAVNEEGEIVENATTPSAPPPALAPAPTPAVEEPWHRDPVKVARIIEYAREKGLTFEDEDSLLATLGVPGWHVFPRGKDAAQLINDLSE
jgi:hypothetical protein